MKKKIFFIVFKYRFRTASFNNFIKIKKINNFKLFNLSGPFKYYLFGKIVIFFIQKFNFFFKNFILISCDGKPILFNNGVNFWFGGTSHKIPTNFKGLKNNCHVFQNFIKKEKNLLRLYPNNLSLFCPQKKPKLVFIGNFKLFDIDIINTIWKIEKNKIFKDLQLIEKKLFWKKYKLNNHPKIQTYYIAMKDLLRFHLIIKLNKKFNNRLIIVGNDWKHHIKSSLKTNYDLRYISSLYKGNICLDFGSKWGNNSLYPRSVDIIERGGLLLQSRQIDSKEILKKNYNSLSFNSFDELVIKVRNLLNNNKKIKSLFDYQFKIFDNNILNYKTLKKIYLISKKNN